MSASQALPEPLDLSHHLSRSTRNRQASSIKQFYKYFAIPGIAQLAGGQYSFQRYPHSQLRRPVTAPMVISIRSINTNATPLQDCQTQIISHTTRLKPKLPCQIDGHLGPMTPYNHPPLEASQRSTIPLQTRDCSCQSSQTQPMSFAKSTWSRHYSMAQLRDILPCTNS